MLATTSTSADYRLYALDTTPSKPGLVRVDDGGAASEVEVWDLDPAGSGSFVSEIPSPLCIGKLRLADGSEVSGFLCEPAALAGAPDITAFGSWRTYLAAR